MAFFKKGYMGISWLRYGEHARGLLRHTILLPHSLDTKKAHILWERVLYISFATVFTAHCTLYMGRSTTISSFFFQRHFVIRHLSSSLDLCQQLPNKNESQPIVSFTLHWVCIAEWPFWDGHCLTSHYQLKNENAFLKKCTRSVFRWLKRDYIFVQLNSKWNVVTIWIFFFRIAVCTL